MPLLPLKKILFPTDFSEPSREALKSAVEMAEHFAAELCILHVIAPIPVADPSIMGSAVGALDRFDIDSYQLDLLEHLKKVLHEMVEQNVPSGLATKSIVEMGSAAKVITDIVASEKIDLIIMATHGLTGISHLFLGSVAEKVVRRSPVPVLTIRQPAKDN